MPKKAAMIAAALLACCWTLPAAAQDAVAQFYRGKTVTVLIGTDAGGPYDTYARLLARYLGTHIPGNPTIIVNNMAGAGSETAATYVARVAPKDGTYIAATFASQPLDPILASPGAVSYDQSRLNYLGSAVSEVSVCLVRSNAPTTNFNDMFKTQVVMGGAAVNTASGYQPVILNNLLGTKFKLVLGYPGAADIMTAIEKGEIDGQCGLGWRAMKAQYASLLHNDVIKVVVQLSDKGSPDLNGKGIPTSVSYARDEEQRRILEVIYSQQLFARPYFVASEVPADRVQSLRRAIMETWQDPQLRADAVKMNLDIDPVSSDTIEAVLKKIYASPPELLKSAREAVELK